MTESYVLTLKLNTSSEQDRWLSYAFWCGQQIYNILVRHYRKQLRKLIRDPEYRKLLAARRKDDLSKKDKNRINQELADIRRGYGLSEYQLHAYVSVQQRRYKKFIDSDVAQKIASSVCRHYIQRDLYSAFLLMNSNATGTAADRQKCIDAFPMFLITHDACMDALLAENKKYPSSFGLRSYERYKCNC